MGEINIQSVSSLVSYYGDSFNIITSQSHRAGGGGVVVGGNQPRTLYACPLDTDNFVEGGSLGWGWGWLEGVNAGVGGSGREHI